jgi:hypothetical protein
MAVGRRRLTRAELVAAATTSARLQGCACNLTVTITEVADGIYSASIGHDDWCPLLAARGARWN